MLVVPYTIISNKKLQKPSEGKEFFSSHYEVRELKKKIKLSLNNFLFFFFFVNLVENSVTIAITRNDYIFTSTPFSTSHPFRRVAFTYIFNNC